MTEMSKLNHLVQQNILEHESRLKHVDELLERAQAVVAKAEGDEAAQLAEVKRERDELSSRVEAYRLRPPESGEAFEKFGPMAVWDTLAKRLENLIERLER
jgi:Na+/phosphate symporter